MIENLKDEDLHNLRDFFEIDSTEPLWIGVTRKPIEARSLGTEREFIRVSTGEKITNFTRNEATELSAFDPNFDCIVAVIPVGTYTNKWKSEMCSRVEACQYTNDPPRTICEITLGK